LLKAERDGKDPRIDVLPRLRAQTVRLHLESQPTKVALGEGPSGSKGQWKQEKPGELECSPSCEAPRRIIVAFILGSPPIHPRMLLGKKPNPIPGKDSLTAADFISNSKFFDAMRPPPLATGLFDFPLARRSSSTGPLGVGPGGANWWLQLGIIPTTCVPLTFPISRWRHFNGTGSGRVFPGGTNVRPPPDFQPHSQFPYPPRKSRVPGGRRPASRPASRSVLAVNTGNTPIMFVASQGRRKHTHYQL